MSASSTLSTVSLHPAPGGPVLEEDSRALQVFLDQRPRLLGIAARVTGHYDVAEDIVQDAWLRWHRVDRSAVQNPAAFLTTVTTHLAINHLQSAPRRRELSTDGPGDPALTATHRRSDEMAYARLEMGAEVEEAFEALLGALPPRELSAYVLRKGLDYSYEAIAALLGTSVANCRQLVRRAQPRIHAGTSRRPVDRDLRRRLTREFLHAASTGHMSGLETLLRQRVDPPIPSASRRQVTRVPRSPAHQANSGIEDECAAAESLALTPTRAAVPIGRGATTQAA